MDPSILHDMDGKSSHLILPKPTRLPTKITSYLRGTITNHMPDTVWGGEALSRLLLGPESLFRRSANAFLSTALVVFVNDGSLFAGLVCLIWVLLLFFMFC